jgi:hypothetical protein
MSLCPKCRAPIRTSDKECGDCGVILQHVRGAKPQYYEPLPYVHCAQDGCGIGATTRIKTPTGYANFCLEHYDEYFTKEAAIYCGSRGLDTPEKQMKHCREMFGVLRKRMVA